MLGASPFLFAVTGIKNGLRRLAGDTLREVEVVRIKLTGLPAAQHNQPQPLAPDMDRGQEQSRGFKTKLGS